MKTGVVVRFLKPGSIKLAPPWVLSFKAGVGARTTAPRAYLVEDVAVHAHLPLPVGDVRDDARDGALQRGEGLVRVVVTVVAVEDRSLVPDSSGGGRRADVPGGLRQVVEPQKLRNQVSS